MEYIRNCTNCGNEIKYKTESALNGAIKRGSKPCRTCQGKTQYEKRISEGNWGCTTKGLNFKEERKKLEPKYWKLCPSDGCDNLMGYTTLVRLKKTPHTKCKRCTALEEKTLAKIIDKATNPSDETRLKMRHSAINRISDAKFNGGQVAPGYNPSSIPIIEQKAKELGITDLQHAENGGEFYVKGLGYFVDGYSAEKNIVIEYDEPHHKRQVEADQRRQKKITEHLNCEFIRISQ